MSIEDGRFRMRRAIVTLDVGVVVNPHILRAQAVSGFVMGASFALNERVTFASGEVIQSGLPSYPLPRMYDIPEVEVTILEGHPEMCPHEGKGGCIRNR